MQSASSRSTSHIPRAKHESPKPPKIVLSSLTYLVPKKVYPGTQTVKTSDTSFSALRTMFHKKEIIPDLSRRPDPKKY